MSAPELPATDDPWALLGVDRDASADVVRRAYLAKIKLHKPDRDPAGFRRIRTAYEAIQSGVGARVHATAPASAPASAGSELGGAGAETVAADDDGVQPSPYLDRAALAAWMTPEHRRTLLGAFLAMRVAPDDAHEVFEWLAYTLVLLDGSAFVRLSDAYPREIRELVNDEEAFALRVAGGPAVDAWIQSNAAPFPELLALMVSLPIANGDEHDALCHRAALALRARPGEALAAIDAIASHGVDGARVVEQTFEAVMVALPEEVRDRRTLQRNANIFTAHIDLERSKDKRLRFEGMIGTAAGVSLTGALARYTEAYALVLVAAALIGIAVFVLYDSSAAFFRRTLRAKLIEQVWAHPVPGQLLVEQMQSVAAARPSERDHFSSDAFSRYVELVANDVGLLLFADFTYVAWAIVTVDEGTPPNPEV